jgi:hypothetical protein
MNRSPAADPAPTFIYILRAGRFVKVGVSGAAESRAASLQTGCPYKIEVFASVPANSWVAFRAERAAHIRMRDRAAHGEWFRIAPTAALHVVLAEVRAARLMERRDPVAPQPPTPAEVVADTVAMLKALSRKRSA